MLSGNLNQPGFDCKTLSRYGEIPAIQNTTISQVPRSSKSKNKTDNDKRVRHGDTS